jgi:hypothetical protein
MRSGKGKGGKGGYGGKGKGGYGGGTGNTITVTFHKADYAAFCVSPSGPGTITVTITDRTARNVLFGLGNAIEALPGDGKGGYGGKGGKGKGGYGGGVASGDITVSLDRATYNDFCGAMGGTGDVPVTIAVKAALNIITVLAVPLGLAPKGKGKGKGKGGKGGKGGQYGQYGKGGEARLY